MCRHYEEGGREEAEREGGESNIFLAAHTDACNLGPAPGSVVLQISISLALPIF